MCFVLFGTCQLDKPGSECQYLKQQVPGLNISVNNKTGMSVYSVNYSSSSHNSTSFNVKLYDIKNNKLNDLV